MATHTSLTYFHLPENSQRPGQKIDSFNVKETQRRVDKIPEPITLICVNVGQDVLLLNCLMRIGWFPDFETFKEVF